MKHLLFIGMIISYMTSIYTCNTKQVNTSTAEIALDLHYLIREPKDTLNQAPVLLLFHGYGSNENNLFALASQIPDNWLVVSVRAPFTIASNQFKWYDVELIDKKITANLNDESKSRAAILQLIDQLSGQYRINENKIVTAGFSQGAIMSLNLALTAPDKILAAGCFSGRFMEEIKPLINNKEALIGKQVFIAHGTQDQMLPLRYPEENRKTLEELGIKTSLSLDQIAHTISSKQVNEFVEWIKSL